MELVTVLTPARSSDLEQRKFRRLCAVENLQNFFVPVKCLIRYIEELSSFVA